MSTATQLEALAPAGAHFRWLIPGRAAAEDLLRRGALVVAARAQVLESLQSAMHLDVHHLPVTNDFGEPVGVVCTCALREVLPSSEVFECMNAPAVSVELGTPLDTAAELMRDGGHGCLPVTRQGIVVGLLSREDLLRLGLLSELDFPRCAVCGTCYHVARDADPETARCRRCRAEGRPWDLDAAADDTVFGG